ncbi:hypothetical protein BD413DRAFT_547843 [Trametes elegans]|nr:hypothetical protein BD413DRAFT_547843 [Trametes elegans]
MIQVTYKALNTGALQDNFKRFTVERTRSLILVRTKSVYRLNSSKSLIRSRRENGRDIDRWNPYAR